MLYISSESSLQRFIVNGKSESSGIRQGEGIFNMGDTTMTGPKGSSRTAMQSGRARSVLPLLMVDT
jgi:hypothetical protein